MSRNLAIACVVLLSLPASVSLAADLLTPVSQERTAVVALYVEAGSCKVIKPISEATSDFGPFDVNLQVQETSCRSLTAYDESTGSSDSMGSFTATFAVATVTVAAAENSFGELKSKFDAPPPR